VAMSPRELTWHPAQRSGAGSVASKRGSPEADVAELANELDRVLGIPSVALATLLTIATLLTWTMGSKWTNRLSSGPQATHLGEKKL
jgi:hypothetical protein